MQEGGVSIPLPVGSGGASTSSTQVPLIFNKGGLLASASQGTSFFPRGERGGASPSVGQITSLPSRAGMSTSAFQVASNTPRAVASTSGFQGVVDSSRQRFCVDLKEGETNVVSWKKLLKEAQKNASPLVSEAPAGANPALEARFGPEPAGLPQTNLTGLQEPLAPPPNRFSSVIEKIERLYKGVDSEDDDVLASPDDSQYDSKDGFIDDTELDEYFSVDKAKTKHTGFFVHRGKLEKVKESPPRSPPPSVHLPRKRKRNVTKLPDGIVAEEFAKKRINTGMRLKDAARKMTVPILTAEVEGGASTVLRTLEQSVEPKPKKRVTPSIDERDTDVVLLLGSVHDHVSNTNCRDVGKAKEIKKDVYSKIENTVVELSDDENDELEVLRPEIDAKGEGSSDVAVPKRLTLKQSESTEVSDDERIFPSKSARTAYEEKLVKDMAKESRLSAPLPKVRKNQQMVKDEDSREPGGSGKTHSAFLTSSPGPKEASPKKYAGWPKGTVLERAVNDLEKGVAEAFPFTGDRQAAIEKAESGGKSKRLPREVKQKLAKVARLAAKKGKIPDEFIDRLMNIIGHVMRLKTLKRNLKSMIEMGLNAKQEKDVRLQDMKREVTELVKSRVSTFLALDAEHQEGSSDDFQANPGSPERGTISGRFKWDEATEDRICDLYEHYVEGMDEHKGPQIRKLYIELAELWPDGWMDNVGIKSAVFRVKERRKKQNKLKMGEEKRRKKAALASEKHKADRDAQSRERYLPTASSFVPPILPSVTPTKEKLTVKSSKQRMDETRKHLDDQSKLQEEEEVISFEERRRLAAEVQKYTQRKYLMEASSFLENGNSVSESGKVKPILKAEEPMNVKRTDDGVKPKRKLPRKSFEGKIVEHGARKRPRIESEENDTLDNLRSPKNSILDSPLLKVKKKKLRPADGKPYPSLRISSSPKKVQSNSDRVVNGTNPPQSRLSDPPAVRGPESLKETRPSGQMKPAD